MQTAPKILETAANTIEQRAIERDLDNTEGERSMRRAVTAFNALTGLGMSTTQGWIFMAILKAARATAGTHQPDDYIDGAAYFALAGEQANRDLTQEWEPAK